MPPDRELTVLVIDDHPIVLSGCRALLAAEPLVAMLEAVNGSEGLTVYRQAKPDVVVIDINLPDTSGLELARTIYAEDPNAKMLMLSMNDDPVFVAEAMRCHARGFASKNGDPRLICDAIKALAAGEVWLPPGMDKALERIAATQERDGTLTFTAREREILRLLANGKTMAEVAAEIGASYKTTANICSSLRERLGARTPIEMITIALDRKLI